MKEITYAVKGTRCASCEIIIEKRLLELEGIKFVDVSNERQEILIKYEGEKPSIEKLNQLFQREGYSFSEEKQKEKKFKTSNIVEVLLISGIVIIVFFLLMKSGLSGIINVNSKSSLISFFALGILAGLSTCAALVGGIILSMSKQWMGLYSDKNTAYEKFKPHLIFNLGRILSYGIVGALLGLLGNRLQLSITFTSLLVLAVSIIMILTALSLFGVRGLKNLQFTLPKFSSKFIADEKKFQGKYMPFVMGALTFLLPCGFTITAQGLALLSSNPIQGALIMLAFVLGTTPALLLIGFSSVKLFNSPSWGLKFSKIAGVLILFFALFNINNQLNVLGSKSLNDITNNISNNASGNNSNNSQPSDNNQTNNIPDKDLPPIVNGKQVIQMKASSAGYNPNYFKVRAGVPVVWNIEDTGTSGCTNAVISNGLFSGQIPLTPGQISTKEFTPAKAGKYKFSCWMGMISGIIEVVDVKSSTQNTNSTSPTLVSDTNVVPSGAQGCGCGGGGGSNNSCVITNN